MNYLKKQVRARVRSHCLTFMTHNLEDFLELDDDGIILAFCFYCFSSLPSMPAAFVVRFSSREVVGVFAAAGDEGDVVSQWICSLNFGLLVIVLCIWMESV